jgi:cation-transporting ATPase 13A1
LIVKGVTLTGDKITDIEQVEKISQRALAVLGGCHTLAMAEGNLVGDPIEKQAFEGIKWKHDGRKTSTGGQMRITQVKRFMFESSLKRMSAIALVDDKKAGTSQKMVLCKGAPEVLKEFIKDPPKDFDKIFQ